MINVTVNGSSVKVEDGSSVLDAVNVSGIPIPQLCKDPDMKPIGACRTCLATMVRARERKTRAAMDMHLRVSETSPRHLWWRAANALLFRAASERI